MTRKPDPLHNLADALSEDIVATPADALVHEADDGLIASFDRIAARAAAQSRRRRVVDRLRGMLPAWPAPIGWTSAMAGVAGICIMVIAGGLYFHQPDGQLASAPPPVGAERMASRPALTGNDGPMSRAEDRQVLAPRAAKIDHAAAEQPAPAAAPPVVAAAPPPAPPAAAGVADEPKRVRTADVRVGAVPPGPPSRSARQAAPPRPSAEDRLAALAMVAEQRRLSTPPQAPRLAPAAPAASSYAPVAPDSVIAGLAEAPPGFHWPLRGRVIAAFGSPVGGAPNKGIDLAAPAGTEIRAAEDGVVLYAGSEIKDLGNLLLLRHRDGFLTAYAHAQSFAVKPGDTVRRGQVIAKAGQTGAVSRPQLHFEIRKENAPVDPAKHLPPPG